MIPAEKITAAIQRLEQLKADTDYFEMNGWLCESPPGDTMRDSMHPDGGPSPITNDPLMVALHRTMDAQLAMLREAERTFTSRADQGVLNALIEHDCMHRWDGHLKLADAILGES